MSLGAHPGEPALGATPPAAATATWRSSSRWLHRARLSRSVQVATGVGLRVGLPALAGAWRLTAAKWGVASALILPQSVLLGMTFPLMSAGVLRLVPDRPGRTLACSTSPTASARRWACWWRVLPGRGRRAAGYPLAAAAALNLAVAAAIDGRDRGAGARRGRPRQAPAVPRAPSRARTRADLPCACCCSQSFATAVASFIYEIAWIRMLALVLGSATHSFELMLSAFILGLALGAWWIRSPRRPAGRPAPHARHRPVDHGRPRARHAAALPALASAGRPR